VKRLTDLMGGRIEAYSELAQGTEVHLTLPLRPASEGKEPPLFIDAQYMEQAMRELCLAQGPLRVLVVEDDRLNQLTALKYLEMIGCEGRTVSSGAEALDVLGRERFDAVFMDVQMPGMDGLETTRRIRAAKGSLDPEVPVVAVTAHARRGDREMCLQAGMNAFVPKPCTPEDLREALLRVVRRS
jgi:CheY-like chemotaxis protein